jgi:hypothetical protein
LYATLRGTRVCREFIGSRSPAAISEKRSVGTKEGKIGEKRTSDTGELGEVVDDRLARMNMIVNEGNARFGPLTAKNGNSSESHSGRSKNLLRSVRVKLGFFLLQRDEFGVD